MNAQPYRQEIEKFHKALAQGAPLFVMAKEGRLQRRQVQRYLENIQYLLRETQGHLARAAAVCKDRQLPELCAFFSEKVVEERGHDAWAEDDLMRLDVSPAQRFGTEGIAPSLYSLLAHSDKMIERDPSLYVGYVLLAEYLTVIVAPEFLDNLERHCGIPILAMSVIANHGILDKQHAEDDMLAIERFTDRLASPEAMLAGLHESMRILWMFFHEIVEDVAVAHPMPATNPPSWLAT